MAGSPDALSLPNPETADHPLQAPVRPPILDNPMVRRALLEQADPSEVAAVTAEANDLVASASTPDVEDEVETQAPTGSTVEETNRETTGSAPDIVTPISARVNNLDDNSSLGESINAMSKDDWDNLRTKAPLIYALIYALAQSFRRRPDDRVSSGGSNEYVGASSSISGGSEGVSFDQLPTNARAEAKRLQSMTPQEVWRFRRDRGPAATKEHMRRTGVLNLKLTQFEILDYVDQALAQDGDFFPGEPRSKQRMILAGLLKAESAWRPFNVSHTGALGLGQMIKSNYVNRWNFNPFNPKDAVRYAAEHLRKDYQRFRRVDYAITAYNRGAGYVAKYGTGGPSREGAAYLGNVVAATKALQPEDNGNVS